MRVVLVDIRRLYDRFDVPLMPLDCGRMCAPHNPAAKPFCCDICHAVPAAHHTEWAYLQRSTDLWHVWRGDECLEGAGDPAVLQAETPDHMLLLACKGPAHCQRPFRLLSCRQFPFFPYITHDLRFLGLAYEWEFEPICWVISNLGAVSPAYRQEFAQTYDELFASVPAELESYAIRSDEMRLHFAALRRRIPILHRNGGFYLLSSASERLERIAPERLQRFGPYQNDQPAETIR
jgi:hypothetical protein